CFRINRSQFKENIFHKTISRMVESKPIYQNQIKQILSV
ncbi:MAG: IS1595 family transposase, partial [Lutibacter sp.]|nr:IS1595 family transposase [Lutibacter sp.]